MSKPVAFDVKNTIQLKNSTQELPTVIANTACNKRVQLQFIKGANGKIHVRGLLPKQQLLRMPNGRLCVINPKHASVALQTGVSLIATGALIPCDQKSVATQPYRIGDKIRIDSKLAIRKIRFLNPVASEEGITEFVDKSIGTVNCANLSKITAKFLYLGSSISLAFNAPFRKIEKLNKYSLNQHIRIKSDVVTVVKIEMEFQHQSDKLKGAIGRVIGIDEDYPSTKVFIQFDKAEIYHWLPKSVSLPSAWMDPIYPSNPAIDKKLLELAFKHVALFLKAVDRGDFRVAQLLYNRHGVDAEARNPEGKTALHFACQKGHKDLVEWLLDEVKVNVEQPDNKGYRPIHYAVLEGKTEVLEILIERDTEMDSQSHCGRTALHIAVLNRWTDCVGPMMNNDADANIQDFEGNTPLHIGILNEAYPCVDEMMPFFSFKWELRNKEGFNIIHLAVVKDSLKTIKFIMGELNVCHHFLELMPTSQSTVLHYACANRNYNMVQLLVAGSKGWMLPDGSSFLGKLLEAKSDSGMTALLIACQNKDYAIVELLVESGADVNALDNDGNTAILLAASSYAPDEIPTKELSPGVLKIYQSAIMMDSSDITKMKIETYPILPLIAYLKAKGFSLEAINSAGVLLSEDSADCIAKILNDHSASERVDLIQQPVFHLILPHGFVDVVSIQQTSSIPDEQHHPLDATILWIKKENPVMEKSCALFNWIQDGSEFGFIQDHKDNRYTRNGSRKDGSIIYRCVRDSTFGRCSSLVRRFKSEVGLWIINLESGHIHPDAGFKRKIGDVRVKEIRTGSSL